MRQANMLLAAALAVAGASAYATSEDDLALSQGEAFVVVEEDDADEGVIVAESVPAYSYVVSDATPVVIAPAATPVSEPITIEQRRLTLDERIQSGVMDAIYNAPNLGGQIGVESNDARVTLTGWTPTAGQARRAAMYAQGVDGVREVQNLIRPRIGGSV